MMDQQLRLKEQNRQIETRTQEIVEKLPFITTKLHFLGYDVLYREYFFYKPQPGLLYVKAEMGWFFLQGEQILALINHALDSKGVREHTLLSNIRAYLDVHLLPGQPPPEHDPELMALQLSEYELGLTVKAEDFRVNVEEQVAKLLSLEERFSLFLANKKCRWAPSAVRDGIRKHLL